jgi:hypothetical protein
VARLIAGNGKDVSKIPIYKIGAGKSTFHLLAGHSMSYTPQTATSQRAGSKII